jgi:uncharacterized membrane protein
MLIVPPPGLVKLFEPWATFYNDSKLTETIVMFAHTGGIVIAGGIAIAADRGTLRASSRADDDRRRHLDELSLAHGAVIAGLVATVISGLLMLTSDLETFLGSRIFWIKMMLVVVLLANGLRMQRAEKRLRADGQVLLDWSGLRSSAVASLLLWLTITLLGVALLNYA